MGVFWGRKIGERRASLNSELYMVVNPFSSSVPVFPAAWPEPWAGWLSSRQTSPPWPPLGAARTDAWTQRQMVVPCRKDVNGCPVIKYTDRLRTKQIPSSICYLSSSCCAFSLVFSFSSLCNKVQVHRDVNKAEASGCQKYQIWLVRIISYNVKKTEMYCTTPFILNIRFVNKQSNNLLIIHPIIQFNW